MFKACLPKGIFGKYSVTIIQPMCCMPSYGEVEIHVQKKRNFLLLQKLEPLDSICFTHLEVLPFVHQKVLDTCKILWQKLILWTSQSELYKTPRVTSICDNSKIRQYLYSFWVLVSEFRLVQVSLWFQGFISVLQRHFLFQSILFCIDQSDNTAQILPYRNVLM